jgi:hypothetical protein
VWAGYAVAAPAPAAVVTYTMSKFVDEEVGYSIDIPQVRNSLVFTDRVV